MNSTEFWSNPSFLQDNRITTLKRMLNLVQFG
jgi:hypothetical protein